MENCYLKNALPDFDGLLLSICANESESLNGVIFMAVDAVSYFDP